MKMTSVRLSLTAIALTVASGLNPALAQSNVFAYPEAGQSEQQQQRDHSECHEWSVQRTGFNPNRQPQGGSSYAYSSPPPDQGGYFGRGQTGQGGVVRDAAGGATLGAIGGAIAGNAGAGAAIGALSGTLFGGIRRSSRQQQQAQWEQQQREDAYRRQQQAQADYQRGFDLYRQAYSACMTARDYSVN